MSTPEPAGALGAQGESDGKAETLKQERGLPPSAEAQSAAAGNPEADGAKQEIARLMAENRRLRSRGRIAQLKRGYKLMRHKLNRAHISLRAQGVLLAALRGQELGAKRERHIVEALDQALKATDAALLNWRETNETLNVSQAERMREKERADKAEARAATAEGQRDEARDILRQIVDLGWSCSWEVGSGAVLSVCLPSQLRDKAKAAIS